MRLEEMRQVVLSHKPYLKLLIQEKGSFSIFDYFQASSPRHSLVNRERHAQCLEVIEQETAASLGNELAQQAVTALRDRYFVSTTDHHEPLSHPFFLDNNLVQSLVNRAEGQKTMVVLACAGVSLNNSSFPRGLFYHNEQLNTERLSFFSLHYRHCPVFVMPAYTQKQCISAWRALNKSAVSAAAHEKLLHLLDLYESQQALELPSYSAQITYTNYLLWKHIPGQKDTNLIYLSLEDVVNHLIAKFHLSADTIVHHVLFDPLFNTLFEKYFEGIPGAFSQRREHGTFLFWGIQNGARLALFKGGACLQSADGSFVLPLTPEAVGEALQNRTIMPSMALSFIVSSFYYGMTCGGGFSQINYLTYMKEAYLRLLNEVGASKQEYDAVANVDTQVFRGEFVIISLGTRQGALVPATALDCILYAEPESAAQFERAAHEITVADAVDNMMHEFYKIVTGRPATYVNTSHGKPTLYTA